MIFVARGASRTWGKLPEWFRASRRARAASAEQDPCVPGANANYFNLVMQPAAVVRIAPGGHQAVTLRAWASGAARGSSWQLQTGVATSCGCLSMP